MNREAAEKAKVVLFLGGLDEAIEYLQECKKKGQNVYVDFNGHRLYSADVTIDGAYMEVVGMTKAEDKAIREEYGQAQTKEEQEAVIAKWKDIKKAHQDAGNEKDNNTVLDSAVEETEEATKTSTIISQAQSIKSVSKGKENNERNGDIEINGIDK